MSSRPGLWYYSIESPAYKGYELVNKTIFLVKEVNRELLLTFSCLTKCPGIFRASRGVGLDPW